MKTVAFVDGYNLYYSRLRKTGYLWLDLHTLLQRMVAIQDPTSELVEVRYYTAYVKASLATYGQRSQKSQNDYHRALRLGPGNVQLFIQRHHIDVVPMPEYVEGVRPDRNRKIKVHRIEEKQTDVKLAVDALRLALSSDPPDQLVFVTSDSDFVPLFETLREATPNITRGLIVPTRQSMDRHPDQLARIATWRRRSITDQELEQAQFPRSVTSSGKKSAIKPDYW